jgi:hypothetical protein
MWLSGSTVDLKRLQEGKPDDLMNTMNTCIQLGHEQKVKAGIIVIIGKPRDRKAYADHYNFPVERVFVVPYNRYMKSGSKVSLRKVPLAMRVVLSDILVAIVKAADKVDQDLNDAEEELTTTSDV